MTSDVMRHPYGHADLLYNGAHLIWPQQQVDYKASSGMYITYHGYVFDHQNASQQSHHNEQTGDNGPIPEGLYSLLLKFSLDANPIGISRDRAGNITNLNLDTREGIEHLPAAWNFQGLSFQNLAWGPDRVRLAIIHIDDRRNRGRSGFYLHDSTKGYSHGCIEVDPSFFTKLREFARRPAAARQGKSKLLLRVKYPSATASTYGGTWIQTGTEPRGFVP